MDQAGLEGESSTATLGRAGPCTWYNILHSLHHQRPRNTRKLSTRGVRVLYCINTVTMRNDA